MASKLFVVLAMVAFSGAAGLAGKEGGILGSRMDEVLAAKPGELKRTVTGGSETSAAALQAEQKMVNCEDYNAAAFAIARGTYPDKTAGLVEATACTGILDLKADMCTDTAMGHLMVVMSTLCANSCGKC
ncbi:unnamed protein product [Prorocentrum cordatum]|uniref:ShKT domain-containing protein n=1 Tax=Prorocentrum cordatum TaxID=2364126 RepID=A0ABN9TBN3_9DINO|nr:unnamed protein product [Polarella glacialis]